MTVFKSFLKIVNKNKVLLIVYTVLLLFFGAANMETSDNNMSFAPSKPSLLIINNDNETTITKNFVAYLEDKTTIVKIENSSEKIKDALFYEDIDYVVTIPKNYTDDFLNSKSPKILVQKNTNYMSTFSELIVNRYLNVANKYQKIISNERDLIKKINDTLASESKITVLSKVDSDALGKAAFYYNFASYSFLACLIYMICLVMSTYNDSKIKKRINVSSTSYKTNNRILLLSNSLFALLLWLFYVIMSFIFVGKVMFSINGLLYIFNSLVFVLSVTSLAFFVSNVITNKNAITGVMNVISLGSSFLCGAFVPTSLLPDFVLKIGHIFPTFYYIDNNNALITLEKYDIKSLKPLFSNMGIMGIFIIVFFILTLIVSKKNRVDD